MNEYLRRLLRQSYEGNRSAAKTLIDYYYRNIHIHDSLEDWFVKEVNENRAVFIHWLAFEGDTRLLKNLLQKGANFDVIDGRGNRPLHYAVQNGHKDSTMLISERDIFCSRGMGLSTQQLEMHQANAMGLTPKMMAEETEVDVYNVLNTYEQKFLFDVQRTYSLPDARVTSRKFIQAQLGGNVGFETTPNWMDAVCAGSQYDWISKPSGQIVQITDDGKIYDESRFCSGVNIGQNYFLTAGHCVGNVCYDIKTMNVTSYRVSFNYQYPNCAAAKSTTGKGDIHENVYKVQRIVEQGTCSNVDYAVFSLEPDAEKYFGHVNLRGDMPHQNDGIVLAHHPAGKPKKVSVGIINAINSTAGEVSHTAHTLGGSSGAAIGNQEKKEVVAVHVRGNEQQTLHTGLSIKKIADTSTLVRGIAQFSAIARAPRRKSVLVAEQQQSYGLSNALRALCFS